MDLGRLKPTYNWILEKTGRGTWRALTGPPTTKDRSAKMRAWHWMVWGRKDMEKGEVPSAFFTSAFIDKICPEESRLPVTNEKGWSNEVLKSGGSHYRILNQVHIHICGTQVDASMRIKVAGWCHWEASLDYLWKLWWLGEVSKDWKNQTSLICSIRASRRVLVTTGQPTTP